MTTTSASSSVQTVDIFADIEADERSGAPARRIEDVKKTIARIERTRAEEGIKPGRYPESDSDLSRLRAELERSENCR